MAITATVALDSGLAMSGQSFGGSITVANSGASPVNIQWISRDVPSPNSTGARVAFNMSTFKPGLISVPASGNTVLPFKLAIFSPQTPAAAAVNYTLNFNVYTDDGSATAATGATSVFLFPVTGTTIPGSGTFNAINGANQGLMYPLLFV